MDGVSDSHIYSGTECEARSITYASNVSCDSKDGVRAGIEAKRNLVTSRQRRVIMRALVPTPAKPGRYQLPSDRRANKFDSGFPSVDDFSPQCFSHGEKSTAHSVLRKYFLSIRILLSVYPTLQAVPLLSFSFFGTLFSFR